MSPCAAFAMKRSMSAAVMRVFDSGAITIAFSPLSATITVAAPEISSCVAMSRVRTPASLSASTMNRPSAPVRPSIRTRAPNFAAAAAWFAPLPPAKVALDNAATVSPARGNARTRTTRSIIIEPTTWMTCCTRAA